MLQIFVKQAHSPVMIKQCLKGQTIPVDDFYDPASLCDKILETLRRAVNTNSLEHYSSPPTAILNWFPTQAKAAWNMFIQLNPWTSVYSQHLPHHLPRPNAMDRTQFPLPPILLVTLVVDPTRPIPMDHPLPSALGPTPQLRPMRIRRNLASSPFNPPMGTADSPLAPSRPKRSHLPLSLNAFATGPA